MQWSFRMLLTLALISIPFHSYVLYSISSALKTAAGMRKKPLRIGVTAYVLWISLYPAAVIAGSTFGLNRIAQTLQKSELLVDLLITYPFWIGLVLAMQLTILFLPIHITRLILFPVYRKHKHGWLKLQSWLVILVTLGAVAYVIARVYHDTFTLRITETQFEVAGLPHELEGFRIVQIADMQIDERTNGKKIDNYVTTINSLHPDLVLFGGDLVTWGVDYIEAGATVMGKMEAPHGVYACLGDHDHFADRNMVVDALQRHGVTVLDNLAAVVPVGSTYIELTGITNVYRTRPSTRVLNTIEEQRLHGPVNILLTHQPSPWLVSLAADEGYTLFLAGHTHGGQVGFPLPGFFLAGSSFETKYVSGFYSVGSMLVSINNGLGLTLSPIRYHAPAEVTLIVLQAKQ